MKKVMVFGAGTSGNGAKILLEKIGYSVILVDDKNGISSKEGLSYLKEIEFLVKSPGIPYNELLIEAKKMGKNIIDEIELAYDYMVKNKINSKIIAVTGTNGKTTTTTKITELLKFSGLKAEFAGNIGFSFAKLILEKRDLDYIVLELSSYQLENLKTFKPFIAMVINLTPDHIERYSSISEYYDVKFNICKNQTSKDYFILNLDSEELLKRKSEISSNIVTISKFHNEISNYFVKNGKIFDRDGEILEIDKLSLKGEHNLENILFIISTAILCGVDRDKIREFLYSTKTIAHRMEEFFDYGKVKFINDSKGTNIEATKYAIEAFKGCTLICGGYDKKLDWNPLVELIKSNVETVYLIGSITEILKERLSAEKFPKDKIFPLKDIKLCLEDIKEKVRLGDEKIILFSPATSSYDQFKSFEDRGDTFKELVKQIFGR